MRFFGVIFVVLISFSSWASDWEKGIAAMKSEAYEKALVHFNKLEKDGEEAAALYYNMGLCYHSVSMNGKALAYYLKTLKANRNHEEALSQIKKIDENIDPLEMLNPPKINLKNRNAWFYIFLISSFLAALLLVWNRLKLRSLGIALIGIVFLLASLLSFYFSYQQHQYASGKQLAVSVGGMQELLTAPTANGSVLEEIPSGTVLKLLDEKKEWVLVEWKGNKAWLKSHTVILV